ncbi:DUF218 domain-containing protein [Xylanibacter ruminicola]|jgi:uncharacterized SAM-binding protein YcdF (DUF218 family)|uniref:DUF218 domain-containing protein n=1 Tax=Xylanibacter ruminicola TaxID=839 RepID=A0A1H5SHY5_XYLRU|nr:YdcF family protein [Xylanibacter ruminicola]MCR5471267.1 YdcF family protein [Prevotella sp.]SEF49548.1 DUF218 domain-containing protein [Xylanibacter ruminicola]
MITDREKILAIVDNDCLTPSDAIILLEGDGFDRFRQAVSLYKQGMAPKIVFSGNIVDYDYGSYPFSEILPLMLKEGMPEQDIIHEDKSLNTREQAVEVVRMAQEYGWKKLILVASHEHQYRAYLTFLREVLDTKSGITLYNAPARNLKWFEDKGWGTRFNRLQAEIDRIERYSAMGHLATAEEVIDYQKWKETQLSR